MNVWAGRRRWVVSGAAVAGTVLTLTLSCQPRIHAGRLNVLFIVIDTLRADHLGCYGYERSTSPNIDSLASDGTLFEQVTAQSSWTLPSIAGMLTGLYATRHQAVNQHVQLPEHRNTLAEILRGRGYRTGAVVSGIFASTRHRIEQGFDDFNESEVGDYTHVSSPGVTDAALEWLRNNRDSGFFLFLHYFDPHLAYIAHPGFEFGEPYDGWVDPTAELRTLAANVGRFDESDLAYLISCYDSEIAFTDHHVGRVLAELQALGLDQSTIVILTSDHGEGFLEHGRLDHGRTLFEEVLHVPLVIRNPRARDLPNRFTRPVELVDLMPTLLEMLDMEWNPQEIDGRSLLGSLRGRSVVDSLVFSELGKRTLSARDSGKGDLLSAHNLRSVRKGNWKLIRSDEQEQSRLFDLASDPTEQTNLNWKGDSEVADGLEKTLSDWVVGMEGLARRENPEPDPVTVVDEKTEERLRALGYIQ